MPKKFTASIVLNLVDNATVGINNWASNLDKKLGPMREKFERMRMVGAGMMAGGAAIAGGLGLAAKGAIDLERTMADTLAITNLTGDAYDKMGERLRVQSVKLSQAVGVSAKDVATSMYDVISAGTTAGSAGFNALTETGLKFAKVAKLETGQAVETLAASVGAFNMQMTDASKVADIFFQTSVLGQTNIPQLAEAMRSAAPVASGLGISIEKTAAAILGLATAGYKGAIAGTAFRQFVAPLSAPTKEAAKWIKAMGVSFRDSHKQMLPLPMLVATLDKGLSRLNPKQRDAAKASIFGVRALAPVNTFLRFGAKNLLLFEKQVTSTGQNQRAFNAIMRTTAERLAILREKFGATVEVIGSRMLPKINTLAEQVGVMLDRFDAFSRNHPKLVDAMLNLTVATAGFLVVGGGLLAFAGQAGLWISGLVSTINLLSGALIGAGGVAGVAATATGFLGRMLVGVSKIAFRFVLPIFVITKSVDALLQVLTTGKVEGGFFGWLWTQGTRLGEWIYNATQSFLNFVTLLPKYLSELPGRIGEFGLSVGKELLRIVLNPIAYMKELGPKLFDLGLNLFTALGDGIKAAWEGIGVWLADKFSWLMRLIPADFLEKIGFKGIANIARLGAAAGRPEQRQLGAAGARASNAEKANRLLRAGKITQTEAQDMISGRKSALGGAEASAFMRRNKWYGPAPKSTLEKVKGEIVVRFNNAPAGMRVDATKSTPNLQLGYAVGAAMGGS